MTARTTFLVNVALACIAGGLIATGMLFASAWLLTLGGLGLFLFLIFERARSRLQAMSFGLIFGLGSAGTGLLPILTALLPDVAPALLLWLIPTVALALATALIALALYLLRHNVFICVLTVVLLALHEELRMWAWALVTYGNGALFEPHLSLTAFGYPLAESHYLLQLTQNVGLLGLTVAAALLSCALALLPRLHRRGKERLGALISLVLAAGTLLVPAFLSATPSPSTTQRVAIFATDVQPAGNSFDSQALDQALRAAPPDVILLPEGKWFTTFLPDAAYASLLTAWFPTGSDVLVIHSSESSDADGRHNTIRYDSTMQGTLATQQKRFIMPEGEYLPYVSEWLLSLLSAEAVEKIPPSKTIVHGTGAAAPSFKGVRYGTLLCSEALSPTLYRGLVRNQGATALISLADPVWFNGSRLLYEWTVRIAKVHAAQNRRYFLAAQNNAPSFVIDPSGTLVASTAWGETGVLLFDLPVAAP